MVFSRRTRATWMANGTEEFEEAEVLDQPFVGPLARVPRRLALPAVAARLAEVLDRWQRTHPIEDSADRRPGRAELNALRALGYREGDEEGLPGLGETR